MVPNGQRETMGHCPCITGSGVLMWAQEPVYLGTLECSMCSPETIDRHTGATPAPTLMSPGQESSVRRSGAHCSFRDLYLLGRSKH